MLTLKDVYVAVSPIERTDATAIDNNSVSRRQTVYWILHDVYGCTFDELTNLFQQDVSRVVRGVQSARLAYEQNNIYRTRVNVILNNLREKHGCVGKMSLWDFVDTQGIIASTFDYEWVEV